jgi:hypothetical protein
MNRRVYRRNPDMVYREVAGEMILVPIHHRAGEEDSIYVLNTTGARAWELADGNRTLDGMADIMEDEFDVDRDTLLGDLVAWASEMLEAGALEEV